MEVGTAQNPQSNELCPSCGNWVNVLSDSTGFCFDCSKSSGRAAKGYCVGKNGHCGNPVEGTKYCWSCKNEHWLSKNADAIERYMAYGVTFLEAKDLVRRDNENKLNCFCCGEEMKASANGHNYFCTKTVRCRTAHRRLKYLMYDRPRLPKETALEKIMEELKQ